MCYEVLKQNRGGPLSHRHGPWQAGHHIGMLLHLYYCALPHLPYIIVTYINMIATYVVLVVYDGVLQVIILNNMCPKYHIYLKQVNEFTKYEYIIKMCYESKQMSIYDWMYSSVHMMKSMLSYSYYVMRCE